jgi:hypothetical protein
MISRSYTKKQHDHHRLGHARNDEALFPVVALGRERGDEQRHQAADKQIADDEVLAAHHDIASTMPKTGAMTPQARRAPSPRQKYPHPAGRHMRSYPQRRRCRVYLDADDGKDECPKRAEENDDKLSFIHLFPVHIRTSG